jgi:hypothetical protein
MSIGSRHTLSRTPRVGACTTQLSLFLLCKTAARKRKLGVHSLSPQFLFGRCWNLSTKRPVIAATPPTQQSRNQTAPATNQGRTRLKGNQWLPGLPEPFSSPMLVYVWPSNEALLRARVLRAGGRPVSLTISCVQRYTNTNLLMIPPSSLAHTQTGWPGLIPHCARRTTTALPWAFREHKGPTRPPV